MTLRIADTTFELEFAVTQEGDYLLRHPFDTHTHTLGYPYALYNLTVKVMGMMALESIVIVYLDTRYVL